ncbi:hypothetical protein TSMEX_000014, partial [Taenia solium]
MLVETVPPEETWRRRLSACRPQSAKALLSTGFTADAKISPIGNSGSRSKSRSASAKRSWSSGGSGQRRSTVGHNASSSQRSSHRHQQQHHEQQGRETSASHGRVSRSLVTAKVSPSQVPPPLEAHLLASTRQQHEFSLSTPNGEGAISSNHSHNDEEVR